MMELDKEGTGFGTDKKLKNFEVAIKVTFKTEVTVKWYIPVCIQRFMVYDLFSIQPVSAKDRFTFVKYTCLWGVKFRPVGDI